VTNGSVGFVSFSGVGINDLSESGVIKLLINPPIFCAKLCSS
jgi:hypothetical protein